MPMGFRQLGAALLACAFAAMPAAAQERVVNVFNWTDYIDPKVVERFTAETGIRVRYDVFDSLETLEARMSAGRSGYDVIVPTSEPTFSRLIAAGALMPLDRSRIPNAAGLDPALMGRLDSSDAGNRHGLIYLWGTIGLGLNVERIRALAPNAPLDSWDLLFKPENARAIARCGITIMDSQTDVVPTVLRYLGLNQNSTHNEDLRRVEQTLLGIRPAVRSFASGGALEQLASGQACLALTYSGDVIQAQVRAAEANRGVAVQYVAPKEGAQLWFDVMAIPRDAPNAENAHAFINFILQPDVMAAITNAVRYPNAVPASKPMIDRAITSDRNVYPTEEDFARFFTVSGVPQAADRARNRTWARFKAGR
ncbi:polyamine ABC transporter substrate-binding protein [Elioraea sp.]|uniref:polyamine ABC transporter substrate-binding protein n=1 Tax=Elioraea sp. TaxID=2185103 RepID=UPI0025C24A17|nr:polyamine ABC transporter substrate-binding protein [Elioraea sp.]